ncbi:DUF4215 domain-containing protein [Nannocystis punicea]|uniref:DUF4215 domain-containing protein n=1 Tax=Nannocystis punicea TaxID=2995304 RepID=A0ABY7HE50_9BACT|nr:DUF4215 domain-containing protein [Nannocystis poenicansa]WAS97360.1 DUF4215 domain-containing protein [Nannocystis poenicansa]
MMMTSSSTTTPEPAVCGDGIVAPSEPCDDGNDDDTDDCVDCQPAECGDGFVHAGVEQCDDGGDNCENCVRTYMRVFVSSVAVKADLKGLAGADEKCQQLANDAGLEGRFIAWLSADGVSAAARLEHSTLPYKRVDGALVANSWNDLVDMLPHLNALDIDEYGDKEGVGEECNTCPVWTATSPLGAGLPANCNNWNSALLIDVYGGECTAKDARWTQGCGARKCTDMAHLYCFEQSQ